MMRAQTFFRRLAAEQRGMAFVELALVAPIMLLLLLGAIDMSRMVSARMDLEQAAQRVTDFALSRRPTDDTTDYLITEAMSATGLPREQISARIWLECNGVRVANFDTGCSGGQAKARYVAITIQDTIDPFFDWTGLAALVGFDGFTQSFVVTGDSTVRFQ